MSENIIVLGLGLKRTRYECRELICRSVEGQEFQEKKQVVTNSLMLVVVLDCDGVGLGHVGLFG